MAYPTPPQGQCPTPMRLLMLEDFAGCVNETFTASWASMSLDFVLVEAAPLPQPAAPRQAMRAPFSLLFRNTATVLFPQQIYPLRHPRLGEVGIFLVPIAQERAGFLYQAVFN